MQGYLSLVLHAHLPFVRHPEHLRSLEETWLYEAMTETYIPLLQMLEGWAKEGMQAPLTLTLTPTLCTMLRDPLLQERYRRHLGELVDLAERECLRTLWEKPFHELASFYLERFQGIRKYYDECHGNLVGQFKHLQDAGSIEIITCAATHAVLPLLADHPPSVRAQVLVAWEQYRDCFGRDPEGIWLPECAYVEAIEPVLREAGLRWFIIETHGLLQANPPPRYGTFAPILTPNGLAVFGRDLASARQVWSRSEGYPGDFRYRDFYRDIGFDLDLDYVRPYLGGSEQRTFTGMKYYRITGPGTGKAVYERQIALAAADEHANHFLDQRLEQIRRAAQILERPPLLVCPYDAELFGHWWFEGLDFLNYFVRKSYFDQKTFSLVTPGQFLRAHPTHQVANPASSSWGEGGYWRVWLNEKNEWIHPHLTTAQGRMSELLRRFSSGENAKSGEGSQNRMPDHLRERALQQAAREILLAQSSDWPFILSTGTSPEYASVRFTDHISRFTKLYEQLLRSEINEQWLAQIEAQDNLFPNLNYRYLG
jgi:1,4-alpha-glucan branching enzyme